MTDLDIIKECRQTGRTRTTTKKLLEKAYETPMTKNEEEIEKVKAEIKVLEKKLSLLEELERTKSPVEEAYKDWWGEYPETGIFASNTDDARWFGFQAGYNAAYAETVAPLEEEHKTLYDILRELDKPMLIDDVCSAVKRWIFQYDCDYGTCEEYLEGYIECQTVLEERLRGLND